MGLSFFNAERARKAEIEKTLNPEISTSPVFDGVEVEKEVEEAKEVQPKPKKKKAK